MSIWNFKFEVEMRGRMWHVESNWWSDEACGKRLYVWTLKIEHLKLEYNRVITIIWYVMIIFHPPSRFNTKHNIWLHVFKLPTSPCVMVCAKPTSKTDARRDRRQYGWLDIQKSKLKNQCIIHQQIWCFILNWFATLSKNCCWKQIIPKLKMNIICHDLFGLILINQLS